MNNKEKGESTSRMQWEAGIRDEEYKEEQEIVKVEKDERHTGETSIKRKKGLKQE